MSDDKYRPRTFEELRSDAIPQTVITEPGVDNVIPLLKPRSLHAVLCEALTNGRWRRAWRPE